MKLEHIAPATGRLASRTTRTSKKKGGFLDALAETCNVARAAELAGVARSTVYDWRVADSDFADEWEHALDLGADALEDEATRRAVEGVDEPVFYQGKACGVVRRYSDTLLIFLLKGRRPEKYRDRPLQGIGDKQTTGAGGGVVRYILTVPGVSDEELAL